MNGTNHQFFNPPTQVKRGNDMKEDEMDKSMAVSYLKTILSNLNREAREVKKMDFTQEFIKGYDSCLSDLSIEINQAIAQIENR